MNINIDKTQPISKRSIFNNIALATVATFLLGNNGGCTNLLYASRSGYNQFGSSLLTKSKDQELKSKDSIFPLKDHACHPLGVVSYLKRDHQIALIEIDAPDQFGGMEHKKMGLLFYATRPLKNCASIHITDQGVVLSYFDGSREPLVGSCIEVDGQWLDGLCNDKQVEPLFDKDSHSRLQATATIDFRPLNLSDYGVASFYDTSSLVLLESSQDKEKFKALDHAGFMVTKCMPASISALAQLVRHLSTNTLEHTDMICSASVSGHTLQPKNRSANVAYCYIRNGWRYRLIALNNSLSSGSSSYCGAMERGVVQPVDGLNPPPQVAVVVANGSEKTTETVDPVILSDLVLSPEESSDDENDAYMDDSWDDSWDYPQYPEEDNDGNTSDTECDTSSIGSSILDEDNHCGDHYTDGPKKDNSGLEDSGIYSDGLEEEDNKSNG